MIAIENVSVLGMEESIRGAKFPMAVDTSTLNREITQTVNSLGRAAPGTGHDNFLNGIIVQFDLKCSNKMWVELQRYHFIDFVSSQSTMHRAARMNLDDAFNEWVDPEVKQACIRLQDAFNSSGRAEDYLRFLYSLPSGMELYARMTTNYRQLKTIYKQRRDHRLPEWRVFCRWLETLPNSIWITGGNHADSVG